MPSAMPRDWSSGVEDTLAVVNRPSCRIATSVNVPPMSTPISAATGQGYALAVAEIPFHHSTEAAAGDRGRALGEAQRERVTRTADVYVRLFAVSAGLDEPTVRR